MSRYPEVWDLEELVQYCNKAETQCGLSDGRYVPARPLAWQSIGQRVKATLMVFRGEADAVVWPGQ